MTGLDERRLLRFPDGFVWGAATAAYQIEGAVAEDGRGQSIWDTFAHTDGRVARGDTGDVAADHYHRVGTDIALMRQLGLDAYRFSVAWPRVQPTGSGPANVAGLDFYVRLVDQLIGQGITPVLTLYHWDLPQELQDAGGWANRDTADRFAEYAALVAERIGDRVNLWSTLNEPWCSAYLGYGSGEHAPGLQDPATALTAAHHLMLAHGRATQSLRASLPTGTNVSIVLNLAAVYPASDTPEAHDAARRADAVANRLFLDPMLRDGYPADLIEDTKAITDWSFVHPGDEAIIGAPIDLLGLNYYMPAIVDVRRPAAPGEERNPLSGAWPGCADLDGVAVEGPVTGMGWPIDARGLADLLHRLRRDYPPIPIMITENGAAFPDKVDGGEVRDPARLGYLREHIAAVHGAVADGVDVRGYFVWSLLDNFEWAYGYEQRFGIIHVDYPTQQRTLKDSAHWYREVIRANAVDAPSGQPQSG